MITLNQIEKIQSNWGDNIVKIGSLKENNKSCDQATIKMLTTLYAFEQGEVLFKPTKAATKQFRLDFDATHA